MKEDKVSENNLAQREKEATSNETLSNVRENEKRSSATKDETDDVLATPDGQFDVDSPSRRDADPM